MIYCSYLRWLATGAGLQRCIYSIKIDKTFDFIEFICYNAVNRRASPDRKINSDDKNVLRVEVS